MKHTSVKSSAIRSIGYDPATKTMQIHFAEKGLYEYKNVPAHICAEFMSAESHGKHFAKFIKGNYAGVKK